MVGPDRGAGRETALATRGRTAPGFEALGVALCAAAGASGCVILQPNCEARAASLSADPGAGAAALEVVLRVFACTLLGATQGGRADHQPIVRGGALEIDGRHHVLLGALLPMERPGGAWPDTVVTLSFDNGPVDIGPFDGRGGQDGAVASLEARLAALLPLLSTTLSLAAGQAGRDSDLRDLERECRALRRELQSDPLTGLLRPSAFEEAARTRLAEGGRFALTLLDVHHGHIASLLGQAFAEAYLTELAAALVATLPEGSLVGRCDTGDFIALTPLAERGSGALAALVQRCRVGLSRGASRLGRPELGVAAIGACVTPDMACTYADLLGKARAALRAARAPGAGSAAGKEPLGGDRAVGPEGGPELGASPQPGAGDVTSGKLAAGDAASVARDHASGGAWRTTGGAASDGRLGRGMTRTALAGDTPGGTPGAVSSPLPGAAPGAVSVYAPALAGRFGAGEIDTLFRTAVARGQVMPWFQPMVDLRSGACRGFEVLARWIADDGSVLTPADFAEVFRDHRIAEQLTARMLDCGLARFARWRQRAGGWAASARLALNLTAFDLTNPGLESTLSRALGKAGLRFDALALEVTEAVILGDGRGQVFDTLRALRGRGAEVSMDDFGTGHGGFQHLRDWPVDRLKIDRGFVAGLAEGPHDRAIVEAILTIAARCGMGVVVEGIETRAQLEQLRRLGPLPPGALGQGWLFDKALPPEALENAPLRYRVDGLPGKVEA